MDPHPLKKKDLQPISDCLTAPETQKLWVSGIFKVIVGQCILQPHIFKSIKQSSKSNYKSSTVLHLINDLFQQQNIFKLWLSMLPACWHIHCYRMISDIWNWTIRARKSLSWSFIRVDQLSTWLLCGPPAVVTAVTAPPLSAQSRLFLTATPHSPAPIQPLEEPLANEM